MSTNPKKAPAQESLEMSETEESKKSIAPAVAVTDIAEYRPHEEQIVRLETTYAKLVVDCSTSEGLASAKEVRVDIRDVRYALDKTTKTALVPYQQKVKEAQARVNQVKEFGETLKTRVLAIEEPVDEAIKAEEKRVADAKAERERIERERVEGIQAKISHFRNVVPAYAARAAADIAPMLERVKASVILFDEYGEFEAEATIARDNAIEQLETLHTAALEREAAAQKLADQQKELEELRAKQKKADDEAQELREQRAKEDRERLKKQQDELDQQRADLEKQQREQLEQQEEQKKQQQARDDQYQRDQEELARLRAQTAAPAPAAAVVAAPVIAEPAPTLVAAADPAPAADAFADSNIPSASEVVEVVAMAFCVTNDEASAWLRAMSF
ncbi:hypothetical protein NHF39_23210 [Pseudomonas proteolytica]|nr:hypothetical protein [Pseudomonas proteolytica]USW94216.1 hypothetical protein NHF39_23210 [Pseudomonas proteolytica]USX01814.1 hypothetical protein NHF41_08340 [Pseudomonas proteolytica]